MSKLVYGPIRAQFIDCTQDSKIKYALNKKGILEIYESENRNPGNHFAVFYFCLDIDDPFVQDEDFETDFYIQTSICELESKEKEFIFHRDKGGSFVFKQIEGLVTERILN